MAAAKMFSKHSKEVIVLEKAKMEPDRCHVPQAYQSHTLLWRGLQTLNRIFPGLGNREGIGSKLLKLKLLKIIQKQFSLTGDLIPNGTAKEDGEHQ
ncbi:MAG: hypothetical protein JST59_02315 [Actinobacteria bacterium]|nr:hypothetical protein [Actinomycetota bacterium]